MKTHLKHLATLLVLMAAQCPADGAVPVRWTAETSRVQPQLLDAWRGDTLDLECTLKSYGQPVSLGAATASLMWQTNGMGNAWWQTNATVSADGVISATWSPSMDPGAAAVAFFLPVQTGDGSSYRAAGQIRFRPSPGADSQISDLPAPGGTIDFGAYRLVNAPWATLDAANIAIEAAITSATGALVIPPAVDLGPYATTGYVAGAITSATGALVIPPAPDLSPYATTGYVAGAITSATGALVIPPAVDLGPYATRAYADAVASNAQVAAEAAIPSLEGYATEQWTAAYFATNYTPPDLSSYASRSYADAAASNAQATAIAAIPSLAGYATEQWIVDYVATNTPPTPDLSSYATRDYADAVASNAQVAAEAAIPSLEGYATQTWTADYVATNTPPLPDLSSYATRDYADAVASNAQAAAEAAIPSLEGYATQTWTADYVAEAVADGVTYSYIYETTRLSTPDGITWQDATGVVWQVEQIYGWSGTVWTNSQDYSAASTGVTFQVVFYPGTIEQTAGYTNSLFGIIYYDDEMSDAWTWSPDNFSGGGGAFPNQAGSGRTNVYTFAAEEFSSNQWYSANLTYGPIGTAGTNAIRRVAYADATTLPGNYAAVSNAAMNARSATDLGVRGAPQGEGSWFMVNGQIVSWNAEAGVWGDENITIDDYGGHYILFFEYEIEFYLDENFSCSTNFGTNTYVIIGYTNTLAQVSQIPDTNTIVQTAVAVSSNYTDTVAAEFEDGIRKVSSAYAADESTLAYSLASKENDNRYNATDLLIASTNAATWAANNVMFYTDGGVASLSSYVLTYQAASNSVGSVALLAGTNVLHLAVPTQITGRIRDFGLTVTTEEAATITLDSSVAWRFDSASTNLAAGSWSRIYCTESPANVFTLQLWTPDSSQEATP